MPRYRNRLEERVADYFGYGEAVLFGRARSGIVALLEVLGFDSDTPFVMPSNICPVLFMAVHSHGANIKLAGVGELNGLASDDSLAEVMRLEKKAGIVMPTHLYGFVQDYPKTVANARSQGWFVLENDTIGTKARMLKPDRTAFGDALVVSFGKSKGIEVGGGGVILTNDIVIAKKLRSIELKYPPLDDIGLKKDHEFEILFRSFRSEPYDGYELPTEKRERIIFNQQPHCKYGFPEQLEEPLSNALDEFEKVVEGRWAVTKIWNHFLAPFDNVLIAPKTKCAVPWRLIRRAPMIRDSLVSTLRTEGIDAGTNFPSLTTIFPRLLAGQGHPGSEKWGREVINLWVTPNYNTSRICQTVDIIRETFLREGIYDAGRG